MKASARWALPRESAVLCFAKLCMLLPGVLVLSVSKEEETEWGVGLPSLGLLVTTKAIYKFINLGPDCN